jgi:hypothetical protein
VTAYFVTFGAGSIFRNYHAVFLAESEAIVRAYMDKKVKAPWSNIYTKEPKSSKPLQDSPECLFYRRAEDV